MGFFLESFNRDTGNIRHNAQKEGNLTQEDKKMGNTDPQKYQG
jgi:hypothetical protein